MKTIGKYIVRGLLGRGGMAKVYKVEIPVIGKIAALKHLAPDPLVADLMGVAALQRMFTAEAVTMAKLRHPNLVDIRDFEETPTGVFYVMDYFCNNLGAIIGESHRTDAPSRVVTVDKAIHYTVQILEGLDALHSAGIIHRDIKPFNILITDQDTVQIGDFGLSKLRGEAYSGPAQLNVGSPYYAAPEQEKNPDHVESSADLYSVGRMLYRMLSGCLPEKQEKAYPLSRIHPDLDKAWDRFIEKSTAADPAERFADTAAMRAELHRLTAEWEARKAHICRMPSVLGETMQPGAAAEGPRRTPVKTGPKVSPRLFKLNSRWQPERYRQQDILAQNRNVVVDRSTGLYWQRSGSRHPLTWHQARQYIDQLNAGRFGGFSTWRLPTVPELVTLLKEPPQGDDFCIAPDFDPDQKWLWSSDRRSYTTAWYVSIDMGFVAWQDLTCYYFVRGVC